MRQAAQPPRRRSLRSSRHAARKNSQRRSKRLLRLPKTSRAAMAKRNQRMVQPKADPASRESVLITAGATEAPGAHFVVFHLADGLFGFRLEDVGEILRMPSLARMPLAPQSLL